MFREHAHPEIARGDDALDALGASVRRRKQWLLRGSLAAAGVVAVVITLAADAFGRRFWGAKVEAPGITGRALGVIASLSFFGAVFALQIPIAMYLRDFAQREAARLAGVHRCDEEALRQAARFLAA